MVFLIWNSAVPGLLAVTSPPDPFTHAILEFLVP
jgi:hypothetical protein